MSSKASIWINVAVALIAGAWQVDAAAADAPASADVNRATVHFADLDVNHAAGAAVLYGRIRYAAQEVCGDPHLPGSHMISRSWQSCVADAVNRAVVAVDRPAVTAYYRLHTKPLNQEASTSLAALPQGQSGR